MSAAAGAPPPPNPQPGGRPPKIPFDVIRNDTTKPWPNDMAHNGHQNWAKNTTVKTCKCKLCDQRVKKYSWKCSYCSRHICAECAEEDGASRPKDKYLAADFLTNVDGCNYQSGQPPYIHAELEKKGLLCMPEKRPEVIMRDMQIKADIKRKKELKAMESQARIKREVDEEGGEARKRQRAGDDEGGRRKKQRTNIHDGDNSAVAGPSRPRNSNGTFSSSLNDQPTLASSKTARRGAVRKSYGELSSDEADDQTHELPSHQKKSLPKSMRPSKPLAALPSDDSSGLGVKLPCAHLDRGDTVIIGAGIIGLSVARELAMKAAQTSTHHKITVLEIRDGPCELASANCSGLLSIHNIPKPMNELADFTMECWRELVETQGFAEATNFRHDSVYQVVRLDGKGKKYKPSWYVGHDLDSFRDDRWTMGKLDTKKLSAWLYQQCLDYGVDFVFHHEIDSVMSAPDKDISSVVIRDVHDRDKARETIRSQNLVFAAGPWTTEVFQHVYQKTPLRLENQAKKVYWYRLQSLSMTDKEDVGLLFADLAEADEALEDKITMVGHTQKHTVTVTGIGSKTLNTNLNPQEALEPEVGDGDAQPLRHLKRIAAKRLGKDNGDVLRADNVDRGFNLISTSDQRLPIIDKVPASGLGTVCTGEEDKRRCGVYLCFGFSMYGTALAPGIARVLCNKMFGDKSGVDDVNFGIPKYAKPAPDEE